METRIAFLPRFDLRMLVGGIIVADDMNLLFRWGALVNVPEEIDPLLVTMTIHALADDLTACNVHGGKERSHAVALVVMGHRLTPALFEGKARLSPIKRLNLALFIAG